MKKCSTYTCTIHCGLREGYDGPVHELHEVWEICQRFCDSESLCVSVTPTRFIFKGGYEDGVSVGLIMYPRFIKTEGKLKQQATDLAEILRQSMGQIRVTVVCSDETITLMDAEEVEQCLL